MAGRKLVAVEFLTLDGIMQGPGGPNEDREGGFEHGGWQMPYNDEVMGKAASEGISSAGGYLFGRKTYEIFAAYWPHQPDDAPFAATLNELPKYVASRTLKEPLEWAKSTLLKGDVADEVRKLKEQPGEDLVLMGSGDLAQTLMAHDLIDEYSLWIHPIVLGNGKRLFRDGGPTKPLRLVDSTTSGTGVLLLTYRPGEKQG